MAPCAEIQLSHVFFSIHVHRSALFFSHGPCAERYRYNRLGQAQTEDLLANIPGENVHLPEILQHLEALDAELVDIGFTHKIQVLAIGGSSM